MIQGVSKNQTKQKKEFSTSQMKRKRLRNFITSIRKIIKFLMISLRCKINKIVKKFLMIKNKIIRH